MSQTPTPPPPSPSSRPSPPWEALEDLAADALAPDEARRLEARIAADPEVAAAWAEVRRLDDALSDLPLAPLPVGLTARIQARIADEAAGTTHAARPVAILRRLAAMLVLALGAWFALQNTMPAADGLLPTAGWTEVAAGESTLGSAKAFGAEFRAELHEASGVASFAVPAPLRATSQDHVVLFGALGLALLLGGLVACTLAHRARKPRSAAEVRA